MSVTFIFYHVILVHFAALLWHTVKCHFPNLPLREKNYYFHHPHSNDPVFIHFAGSTVCVTTGHVLCFHCSLEKRTSCHFSMRAQAEVVGQRSCGKVPCAIIFVHLSISLRMYMRVCVRCVFVCCLDCPVCAALIPSPSVGLAVVGAGVDWGKAWRWWGVCTKSPPESAS